MMQKNWTGNSRFLSNIEHDILRLKSLRIETLSSIWIFQFRYFFFFARLSNDWSTLGRWLFAVNSYFPTCYSSMRQCDSRVSRVSRCPSAFRSVPRELLVLQAALFGYREFQQRNRRISVSIGGPFPFRVEWLLTTCRWIDSKKIRSLRVRGDVLYVRAKFKDARNTSTKNFGERNKFLLNSLTLEDVSFNSLL